MHEELIPARIKVEVLSCYFPRDKYKVERDEIWTIIATRPDCVELDKFFFSMVECTGNSQLRPEEYVPLDLVRQDCSYCKNLQSPTTCV